MLSEEFEEFKEFEEKELGTVRIGEWAMGDGRFGVAGTTSGRAKNSARRWCCCCLRCSAPVLSRCHDAAMTGPSLGIECRSLSFGGITTRAAAQNRRGLAWQRNRTLGAPSFSPYRSRVPCADTPVRLLLAPGFQLLTPLLELLELLSLAWQFGGPWTVKRPYCLFVPGTYAGARWQKAFLRG